MAGRRRGHFPTNLDALSALKYGSHFRNQDTAEGQQVWVGGGDDAVEVAVIALKPVACTVDKLEDVIIIKPCNIPHGTECLLSPKSTMESKKCERVNNK